MLKNKLVAGILSAVTASIFLVCGFALAASDVLQVSNATITDKSDGVSGEIASFEDNKIANSVTFHKLGDQVEYSVEIKNIDSVKHRILSVSDDNQNQNISYSYEITPNIELEAGEVYGFRVIAKYE